MNDRVTVFSFLRDRLLLGGLIFSLIYTLALAQEVKLGMRAWTSSVGSTMEAEALEMIDGVVVLKNKKGKEMELHYEKLSEEDHRYLEEKFGKEAFTKQPMSSGDDELNLNGWNTGQVTGPIQAGKKSTYYYYIPNTLKKGRKAPLLFHTAAHPAKEGKIIKRWKEGAELTGWIVATSMQSSNVNSGNYRNADGLSNQEHTKVCIKHIKENLPIADRYYFTGISGGGSSAMKNTQLFKETAGAMPMASYLPSGVNPPSGHYFVANGTLDYNRYTSANMVSKFNKGKVYHKISSGRHNPGLPWVHTEGIAWLNGKYLNENVENEALLYERLDFEYRMLDWIKQLNETAPYRAYYWACFMTADYQCTDSNLSFFEELKESLGQNEVNLRYVEAEKDIQKFSEDVMASYGFGARMGHTDDKMQKGAKKLQKKYQEVPVVEDTFRELGEKTLVR